MNDAQLRAAVNAAALGDRIKFLRTLLDFLKNLNLDRGELLELIRGAIDLFSGEFSLEKLLVFIDLLLGALEGPAAPSVVRAQALDLEAVARLLLLLLGWLD